MTQEKKTQILDKLLGVALSIVALWLIWFSRDYGTIAQGLSVGVYLSFGLLLIIATLRLDSPKEKAKMKKDPLVAGIVVVLASVIYPLIYVKALAELLLESLGHIAVGE